MDDEKTVPPLYKTEVVIWSEFDPHGVELSRLAREAESGEAYCSRLRAEPVEKPWQDPDWDGTDFFGEIPEEG